MQHDFVVATFALSSGGRLASFGAQRDPQRLGLADF
jgi:hypothetical protein